MAEYRDEHIPLAYLITFRAYGTWLHGDKRGSVNRFHNRFGTSLIAPNERWRKYNHSLLSHSPVKLREGKELWLRKQFARYADYANGSFGQRM
jgi:hypothetical protein